MTKHDSGLTNMTLEGKVPLKKRNGQIHETAHRKWFHESTFLDANDKSNHFSHTQLEKEQINATGLTPLHSHRNFGKD